MPSESRRTAVFLRLAGVAAVPAQAANFLGRGHGLYLRGRMEDAPRAWRQAHLRAPGDAEAALNLGILYRGTGRPAQAGKKRERKD